MAQLYDALLTDDEIPADIAQRVNATLRSEFMLRPKGRTEMNRREKNVAEAWDEYCPDDAVFDLVANWLILGAGVATIDWATDDPRAPGLWVPKLRTLPTEFLSWQPAGQEPKDAGKAGRWYYQTRAGIEEVIPGNGKWVLMTHGERGWVWGLVRGLAMLWLGKQLTLQNWQRYNQKHGLPILKATLPIQVDKAEKAAFIDALSEIQSEGIIGLPKDEQGFGYEIDLLEAKDQAWQTFQNDLERSDRKIQVMLLGGNLGTEVTSGGASRAAAETHRSSLDRSLAKNDARRLGAVLRDQFLRPFFELNFGPDADVPFPFWDTCPEEDIRTWAEAQSKFAATLEVLGRAGYLVENLEDLGSQYGLSLTKSKPGIAPDGSPPPAPAPATAAPGAAE